MSITKRALLAVACIAFATASAQAANHPSNFGMNAEFGEREFYVRGPNGELQLHTRQYVQGAGAFNPSQNFGQNQSRRVRYRQRNWSTGQTNYVTRDQYVDPFTGQYVGNEVTRTFNQDGSMNSMGTHSTYDPFNNTRASSTFMVDPQQSNGSSSSSNAFHTGW